MRSKYVKGNAYFVSSILKRIEINLNLEGIFFNRLAFGACWVFYPYLYPNRFSDDGIF